MKRWAHFHHGADIGIRGIGSTLAEALAAAAEATAAVAVDPSRVDPVKRIEFGASAEDEEMLLFSMLDELIFRMRRFAFASFEAKVEKKGDKLAVFVTGKGEELDPVRHQPAVEIKGPTMTELYVGKENDHWVAQCVVDV